MPEIQRIQLGPVQRSPYAGAMMNPAAAAAPGQAAGQAAMAAVGAVAQFKAKSDALKNAAFEANSSRRMMTTLGEFQNRMENDPKFSVNEQAWAADWEKELEGLENSLFLPEDTPNQETRFAVKTRLDDFKAKTRLDIGNKAQRKANDRNVAKLELTAQGFAERGDFDGAMATADMIAGLGGRTPEQVAEFKRKLATVHDGNAINREMAADPIATLERIEHDLSAGEAARHFPGLTDDQAMHFKREAETRVSRLRQETLQGFVDRIGNGDPKEMPSDEDYAQAVVSKTLFPTQVNYLKQLQRKGGVDEPHTLAASIADRIRLEYKPTGSDDKKMAALKYELIGNMSLLPDRMQTQLIQDIEAKEKGPTASEGMEDSLIRTTLASIVKGNAFGNVQKWNRFEISQAQRRPSRYGMSKEQALALTEHDFKDKAGAETASERSLDLLSDLRAEILKRGGMPLNEQWDFLHDRIYGDTESSAAASILEAIYGASINPTTGVAQ